MKKTNRRKFIKKSLQASVYTAIGAPVILNACAPKKEREETVEEDSLSPLSFSQIALAYAYDSLEPNIDTLTMDIHYNKHHAAYIKNVNEAISEDGIEYADVNDFFDNISKLSIKARNNGGGAWNHNFFWQCMHPGSSEPSGKIFEAINGSFGSVEKFKEEFTNAAMTRFGSGWAWLVEDAGTLKIGSTPNQDNPLMDLSEFKGKPLLGIDVWEHAYYLHYQNKRNEYVGNWWNTVNWDFVASNLS